MKFLLPLALALTLAACAQPVPPDKLAYVGEWKGGGMWLLILQSGRVEYERAKGSGKTSVSGPLKKFEGDNFSVGIGLLTTTFVVSKPPYPDAGVWKMVVDGVELTRIDDADVNRTRADALPFATQVLPLPEI